MIAEPQEELERVFAVVPLACGVRLRSMGYCKGGRPSVEAILRALIESGGCLVATKASRQGQGEAIEQAVGCAGAVALSTPWEYHYQDNAVATLTPDLPGKYVLKVAGEQVFADPVNAMASGVKWAFECSGSPRALGMKPKHPV